LHICILQSKNASVVSHRDQVLCKAVAPDADPGETISAALQSELAKHERVAARLGGGCTACE